MAQVKLLIEGYAMGADEIESASSAVVLVQDDNLNAIVDPGMNRKLLLDSLAKERLNVEDIDCIILTHNHLDHSLLAGIFPNAEVIDDSGIYSFDGKISTHNGKISNTSIEIIKTPGHDQFHCSVLASTGDLGTIVIAGDVFWWRDEEKQETDKLSLMEHNDPYVKDKNALKESREKILELADYIIPGHGKMFRVEK